MKQEVKIILYPEEHKSQNGTFFEELMRTIFEQQGYKITSNINFTGLEIDLWCKHSIRNEKLLIECKAKTKPLSTEIKNFVHNVQHKEADFGYFLYTEELDHQAAGLVEEYKNDPKDRYKNLTFFGPDEIIKSLVSNGIIKSLDKIDYPPSTVIYKKILAYTYFGNYYILITSPNTSVKKYYIYDAINIEEIPSSDTTKLNTPALLGENIPELKNYEYKSTEAILDEKINITEEFLSFLNSTELLTKAHSEKENIYLEDIFIYPELSKFDEVGQYENKISSDLLISDFINYSKILIAGENQSGKTTLCKKIFIELWKLNFIPVYISNKKNNQGLIENRISTAYKEQYGTSLSKDIDLDKIIPIIDDFHFVKKKENHINNLSKYKYLILTVDDIFSLNINDEKLISSFTHFKLEELTPLLRNELIKKWITLTEQNNDLSNNDNIVYKYIDEKTELVDATLGKIFGKGIMPAYPFFIISIISTYDTFVKPLNQEITSQGYCYQAFIYMYLRKEGVKNDDIDTYINFLTEFSFFFYSNKKGEISSLEFKSFMDTYLNKYNLPVKKEILISKLNNSQIISIDNFGNYSFCYQYIYLFFVAKYFADNIGKDVYKDTLKNIINNLHNDENAYIIIFISHHSKNNYILDEIILNAMILFKDFKPALLTSGELRFFDERIEDIVNAVLPPTNSTPEIERNKRLQQQSSIERDKYDDKYFTSKKEETNSEDDNIELRRSIRTVEVMGHIIKNHAGSLEKGKLELIFEEAMNVILKVLTSFFELVRHEESQHEIVKFIQNRLNSIVKKQESIRVEKGKKVKEFSNEELEIISKKIFWNMNFFIVYILIDKTIKSIGSSKLSQIIESVCDKINSPASQIVKHGTLMWCNKNLQVDNIDNIIKRKDFSDIAKKIMKYIIVNHCSIHKIDYKDKQRLEAKLGIPMSKLKIL